MSAASPEANAPPSSYLISNGDSQGETAVIQQTSTPHHELIEEINDCAAIIQRGKLRLVNDPFIQFMGYDSEELVDKSLINFVNPTFFTEIKQHYVDRLKGIDTPTFHAIFITKDQEEIPMEVNTKPTIFNGDQAEIAVFKKVDVLIPDEPSESSEVEDSETPSADS